MSRLSCCLRVSILHSRARTGVSRRGLPKWNSKYLWNRYYSTRLIRAHKKLLPRDYEVTVSCVLNCRTALDWISNRYHRFECLSMKKLSRTFLYNRKQGVNGFIPLVSLLVECRAVNFIFQCILRPNRRSSTVSQIIQASFYFQREFRGTGAGSGYVPGWLQWRMGAHGWWGTLKRVGEKAEDSLPEPQEAPPTSITIPPAPTIY